MLHLFGFTEPWIASPPTLFSASCISICICNCIAHSSYTVTLPPINLNLSQSKQFAEELWKEKTPVGVEIRVASWGKEPHLPIVVSSLQKRAIFTCVLKQVLWHLPPAPHGTWQSYQECPPDVGAKGPAPLTSKDFRLRENRTCRFTVSYETGSKSSSGKWTLTVVYIS